MSYRNQTLGDRESMLETIERLESLVLHERAEASALREALNAMTEQKDAAYAERDQCVALIARGAFAAGWRVGLARHVGDPWDDDWRNIVLINLPTGQVSWHFHDSERPLFEGLPQHPDPWDGHDTPEKYRRVNAAFFTSARSLTTQGKAEE